MIGPKSRNSDFGSTFSFWLMAAFLVILWFAGGASRPDVPGQFITRFFAWSFLVAFILISPRFEWRRVQPVLILVGLSVILVALQLVPLPPAIWMAMPGRELLTGAAEVSGQPQPWRALSISPGATVNALGALVVPATILVLAANLTHTRHWGVVEILLALIFAGCVVAMLQFSGANFDNPLLNYAPGAISGNFANRNHFALFVALGCLVAPIWGFQGSRQSRWTGVVGIALLPFFLLVILATGSRAGLALGGAAILVGLVIVRGRMMQVMRSWPRWMVYALAAGTLAVLVGSGVLAFELDRAIALKRAFDLRVADDLRSQALPLVIDAIQRYFPVGTGFGTFDQVYRIGEPDALLQPLYFNHAHNDWLEIVLDGGVAAAALMAGALLWFGRSALRTVRLKGDGAALGRIGLGALLLSMFASVSDYPVRTPMWMAIFTIAAVWLHSATRSAGGTPADATHP